MQVKMPLFLILILILIFYYNMRAIHLFYQLLASSPSGPLSRPPFAVPTTELMANAGAPEGTREGKFPRAGKDPYCKPNFARKLRHLTWGSVLPAALALSRHHGCKGVGDRLAYPGHEWCISASPYRLAARQFPCVIPLLRVDDEGRLPWLSPNRAQRTQCRQRLNANRLPRFHGCAAFHDDAR